MTCSLFWSTLGGGGLLKFDQRLDLLLLCYRMQFLAEDGKSGPLAGPIAKSDRLVTLVNSKEGCLQPVLQV